MVGGANGVSFNQEKSCFLNKFNYVEGVTFLKECLSLNLPWENALLL